MAYKFTDKQMTVYDRKGQKLGHIGISGDSVWEAHKNDPGTKPEMHEQNEFDNQGENFLHRNKLSRDDVVWGMDQDKEPAKASKARVLRKAAGGRVW